jgi:zinc transporter 1/2/3
MTASSSSSSSSLPAAVPNAAPVISLITSKGFGVIVDVKRMGQYQACADGVTPTADSPCEPGATAVDPNGSTSSSGATSSRDLTAAVVVCPPAVCLSSGCSAAVLRRHYVAVKGLAGCGIDTAAAVGTRFTVDFWVW